MATQTLTSTGPEQDETVKKMVQQLREQFADAPELVRTALENILRELTSQVSQTLAPPVASAGRIGIRQGKVSELTVIAPVRTRRSPAAARLAALAQRQV